MPLMIGAKLPGRYYEYAKDPRVARLNERHCQDCGHFWFTVEIPLYRHWEGHQAHLCPVHFEPGKVTQQTTITAARKNLRDNPGLLKAVAMGGVYRRRQCVICTDCQHTEGRHQGTHCTARVYELCGCREIDYRNRLRNPGEICRVCWHPAKRHKMMGCEFNMHSTTGECGCRWFKPCLDKRGKRTRWTTVEVAAEGIVMADVTVCERCGGRSKIKKEKRSARKRRRDERHREAMRRNAELRQRK